METDPPAKENERKSPCLKAPGVGGGRGLGACGPPREASKKKKGWNAVKGKGGRGEYRPGKKKKPQTTAFAD